MADRKIALACLAAFMIVPLAGITTDSFAPSLPAIQSHFATTQSLTPLTIK